MKAKPIPSNWVEVVSPSGTVIIDCWEPIAFSNSGTAGTDVHFRGGASVFLSRIDPNTARALIDAQRERIRAWEAARRFPGAAPVPKRRAKAKR
jgi:hypothetical protein